MAQAIFLGSAEIFHLPQHQNQRRLQLVYIDINFSGFSGIRQTPGEVDKCILPFGTLIDNPFIEAQYRRYE